MKNTKFRKNVQRGFSLIEILVALAILSVISLLASNAFDGSRTKAQAMIALGKQIGDANIQLKTDTGCFVNNAHALFSESVAQVPANNYCNQTFGATWARPYLGQYPVDASGNVKAFKISSDVVVGFGVDTTAGKKYFVKFENVPSDIIKQALIECNNTDASAGSFATDRCTAASLVDATSTFNMLYATTR